MTTLFFWLLLFAPPANSEAQLRDADFVLWKGHCSVHALFRPEHVDEIYKAAGEKRWTEAFWPEKAPLQNGRASLVVVAALERTEAGIRSPMSAADNGLSTLSRWSECCNLVN